MEVITNEKIPLDAWNDFIERNGHASPFHLPSFFRFFNTTENISAKAYAVTENDTLKALAVVTIHAEKGPAGFFSRRQIIYGGPLADDDSPSALNMLLVTIDKKTDAGVIYSEVRNLSDYSLLKDVFIRNGYEYIPFLNLRVDTRDQDLMIKRMSNSRLRQIRKAEQQSVTCTEALNEIEVRLFYMMLKDLYKKKLHKPLPSEDFFVKFYAQGLGKYLLVRHHGEIIGGIMCPMLPGRALYEFYICGRDDDYKSLYPSVMATWSAMEYACRNNFQFFDFMGAGKPDEPYGVREFKSRFGGELVDYGRFIKVNKPFLYKMGKMGLKLVSRLG